jgi:quercetin dioxygenase-like cupin family protein
MKMQVKQPETVWFRENRMTIVADADSSAGAVSVIDSVAPGKTGPPLHSHPNGETFYLLDGEVAFIVDGEITRASAGECVHVPKACAHSFRILSPAARMIVVCTPAGHERLFTTLGVPAGDGLSPPGTGPAVPDLVAASAEFGMTILGPPPPELADLAPAASVA